MVYSNLRNYEKLQLIQMADCNNTFFLIFSIRSIICLNLPSFSGGLNPWGMPRRNALRNVSSDLSFYISAYTFELNIKAVS